MTPNQLLMRTGKRFGFTDATGHHVGVQSLLTGKCHPILQSMAQRHAEYQANHREQGHQLWDARVQELYKAIPECHSFAENAAESWPESDLKKAARDMYTSWIESPGHWAACNSPCNFWGTAMSMGDNGIWYAATVFGYLQN